MQGTSPGVQLDNDAIVITNATGRPLYYAAFPVELLPAIEWAPCANVRDCREVEIGAGQSGVGNDSLIQPP